jgi:hypothetical protein
MVRSCPGEAERELAVATACSGLNATASKAAVAAAGAGWIVASVLLPCQRVGGLDSGFAIEPKVDRPRL